MSVVDVSILIVHMDSSRLARQTLRNLRRISPSLSVEILVIDNNPGAGFGAMLAKEFPEVRYFPMDKNRGFGTGMNVGIREAKGERVFIFNPDIVPESGTIEKLVAYLDAHPDIGILGPQLLNADGTLQYSCSQYPKLITPALRRTPLGKLPWAKKHLAEFAMRDVDHDKILDVDWVMGSAMMARREHLQKLGGFDESFFMYFEDADLCRRTWENGLRVVYYPEARMVHYHRRATADGSLFRQLLNPLAWRHIESGVRFFMKYRGKENPREAYHASRNIPPDPSSAPNVAA